MREIVFFTQMPSGFLLSPFFRTIEQPCFAEFSSFISSAIPVLPMVHNFQLFILMYTVLSSSISTTQISSSIISIKLIPLSFVACDRILHCHQTKFDSLIFLSIRSRLKEIQNSHQITVSTLENRTQCLNAVKR